jgi:hypothetical protein
MRSAHTVNGLAVARALCPSKVDANMAVCWNSVRTAEEEDASRRRQLHSKRNTRRRLIVGDAQLLLLRCRINYIMYKCTGAAGVCVSLVCVCAYSYIQINKITHQCHRGEWIIFPPVVKTMGAAAAATAEK